MPATRPTRVTLQGIRFSDTDAEVILHRLGIPDALAEALTDVPDDCPAPAYSAEDVLEAAGTLERVFRGELLLARPLTPVECDTLADTIEGSTWASFAFNAQAAAELGERAVARIHRELEIAGAKVAELLGRPLDVPTC